jgi:hypothetical protein
MKTVGMEPVLHLHRRAKKHIVIEIEIPLGQTWNVVNPGLDVA